MDKMLDVEKGWAEREKFQEVTKVKQQFGRIIDEFCQKTRSSITRFSELVNVSAGRHDQSSDEDVYLRKVKEVKEAVDGVLREVDGIVKPLSTQIKYS